VFTFRNILLVQYVAVFVDSLIFYRAIYTAKFLVRVSAVKTAVEFSRWQNFVKFDNRSMEWIIDACWTRYWRWRRRCSRPSWSQRWPIRGSSVLGRRRPTLLHRITSVLCVSSSFSVSRSSSTAVLGLRLPTSWHDDPLSGSRRMNPADTAQRSPPGPFNA